MRLRDFTPISDAELLGMVLALGRVPVPFYEIFIITDSLSFAQSLSSHTSDHQVFFIVDSCHLNKYYDTLGACHRGTQENKIADRYSCQNISFSADISPRSPLAKVRQQTLQT